MVPGLNTSLLVLLLLLLLALGRWIDCEGVCKDDFRLLGSGVCPEGLANAFECVREPLAVVVLGGGGGDGWYSFTYC
jgi:hypothetical protein